MRFDRFNMRFDCMQCVCIRKTQHLFPLQQIKRSFIYFLFQKLHGASGTESIPGAQEDTKQIQD
jgi:hypothetical protein